jgi:hypothetical protein
VSDSTSGSTKRCPFCAEEIQEAAIVCKHCGRDLVPMPSTQMAPVPAPPPIVVQAPAPRTNGMAIASLVLGILWLYWVGSILALVFGYSAKKQIDASSGKETGRGLAVAGIVLGWVGIGFLVIGIIVAIAASTNHSSYPYG